MRVAHATRPQGMRCAHSRTALDQATGLDATVVDASPMGNEGAMARSTRPRMNSS